MGADVSATACDVLRQRVDGPVVLADVMSLPFDDATAERIPTGLAPATSGPVICAVIRATTCSLLARPLS
jgi:hypothetical protein